jgi:hypothetical protein
MVRSAVAIRGISMTGQDYFDVHFGCALHDRFKIVNFEPEQHSVSIRLVIGIADRAVMVFYFKAVQLKHEAAV